MFLLGLMSCRTLKRFLLQQHKGFDFILFFYDSLFVLSETKKSESRELLYYQLLLV